MAVAVGVATHVVINRVLSYFESTTYTVVQALLSRSADQQDKGTHNKKYLST